MFLINKKQLSRITVSFYKYFYIKNPILFKDTLLSLFNKLKIFGRIYVSEEGINAQISILKNDYEKTKQCIYKLHSELSNVLINESLDNMRVSFIKLKVKVRKKIVSDGISDVSFNHLSVGKYINAFKVNKMLNKKNTIFVDIRNEYEHKIGRFKNSMNIPENTFRNHIKKLVSFLYDFKKHHIVLYCTGGIRCEKSTSLLLHHKFKNIYHIKGAIIGYVNDAKRNNLPVFFKGKIFVFDLRMYEMVSKDVLGSCFHCKLKYDIYRNCRYSTCNYLFIQCVYCSVIFKGYCSLKCMNNHTNN